MLVIFILIILLILFYNENKFMRIITGGFMAIFFLLWADFATKK